MFEGFLWFLTQNIKNVAVGNCLERGSPVKKHLAGDCSNHLSMTSYHTLAKSVPLFSQ